MEYKQDITQPLITTTPEEEKRGDATTELEIQEEIDTWVDREVKNALTTSTIRYWRTTTVELHWNQIDTSALETRLREYYVKKLQVVYKANKDTLDYMRQMLMVTKQGIELGLVVYISNVQFLDNCIRDIKRFFWVEDPYHMVS